MQSLKEEWLSYRRQVVPSAAEPEQIQTTRYAFYAGAISLMHLILSHMEPGTEASPEDVRFMVRLQRELDAFGQEAKERMELYLKQQGSKGFNA